MFEFNENKTVHACGEKILQRADVVWSKIKLEPGEVLLVKVAQHMSPHINDLKGLMDEVFGKDSNNVLLFVDGDVEFTKVQR